MKTFKNYLDEILENYDGYDVLSSVRNYARVENPDCEIYKLDPKDYGFNALNERKDLNQNKFNELKNKILKLLGIYSGKKKFFKIPLDTAISINQIIDLAHEKNIEQLIKRQNKIIKFKQEAKKDINEAIEKYCSGICFIEPISLTMSFNNKIKDISNQAYMLKLVEDCLVESGIIKDDSEEFIKEITINKQDKFEGIIVILKKVNE